MNTPHDASQPESSPLDFWHSLNAVAAALQRSAQSQKAVYDAFGEQLIALGLHAGVSFLNDEGTHLTVEALVLSSTLRQNLDMLTTKLGFSPEGYQYELTRVPMFQQVIRSKQPYYLTDSSEILRASLPRLTHPIINAFTHRYGSTPASLTPLIQQNRVVGILYASGPSLHESDLPAISALTNQLSIALENAQLFQSLREESDQLRRQEQQLRSLAENLPGVLYLCQNNERFETIYVTDNVESLTGYPKQMFLRGEISFRDLFHPEDSPQIIPENGALLSDNASFHRIYRLKHRSGDVRWVEEFGSGVYGEDGQLLFLEGNIIDITERRQAEILQETLYRIANVANETTSLSPLYAAIHHILGDLMDVRNFYIASLDPLIGKIHLPYFVDEMDTFDGNPFPAEGSLTSYVIKAGQPTLLCRSELKQLIRKGDLEPIGTLPQVWLGIPLQTQSGVFGAVVVQNYQDASAYTEREKQLLYFISGQIAAAIERKQSEEQLRQMTAEIADQAQLFAEILSTTPDEFAVLDTDGRYTFVSPVLARSLGLKSQMMLGRTAREMALLPLDILTLQEGDHQQVITSGKPHRSEYHFTSLRGNRDMEVIFSPIKDAQGNVTAVVSAARDVTERNKTKFALHQAQKTESLAVLAGGVAHDFNNLLVGMIAQTSLALAKLPGDSPAARHIQKAGISAERAAVLTKQLLAYSGQGQFMIQSLNLNEIIHDNLHLLKVATTPYVEIQTRLAPSLPLIEGDPGQMQQVLINLVVNGSEAMAKRPGSVLLTTGTRTIRPDDERYWQVTNYPLPPGEYVFMCIHDEGSGMDAESQMRIFEPFFSTKFTGRGLGLAAVLGIVRGHEGGLHVYSVPNEGTTFEIVFPVSFVQPEETAYRAPVYNQAPGYVLVIDDERPVREAITDILELEGVEVITAVDGESGISTYRQRQAEIELVLLDLSLPDLRGEKVFEQLMQINPDVRVILSSGYSESEAIQGFGREQLVFLQKPFSVEELVRLVNDALHIESI